jgi:ribonuclease HI
MSFHYSIVFDGGSRGNGSQVAEAYGSYHLQAKDGRERTVRLSFPTGATNNEAEYDSLIASLEDLTEVIKAAGKDPASYTVQIQGDSQLVINQITGQWRAKAANMATRCRQAQDLLAQFGQVAIAWQPREHSVAVLGH